MCVLAGVPSHYTTRQCRAILDSASIAGLTANVRLVNSLHAAAAAYACKHRAGLGEEERMVLIVDAGAAITSVGVYAFSCGGSRCVAGRSLPGVGADRVHALLFDYVAATVAAKHGVVLTASSRAGGRAMRECEKAKRVWHPQQCIAHMESFVF